MVSPESQGTVETACLPLSPSDLDVMVITRRVVGM